MLEFTQEVGVEPTLHVSTRGKDWIGKLMPRGDLDRFGPLLENVGFQNTRFDPDQTSFGGLAKEMAAAFGYSAELGVEPRLLQLLRLRVAQLNPCSYCLILHTEVAIKIGIPLAVAAHLPSWRESRMFAAKERAALAYCEALTTFDQERFATAHHELRTHCTERETAEVAAVIINMNVWTRLKLAQGAVPRRDESERDVDPQAG